MFVAAWFLRQEVGGDLVVHPYSNPKMKYGDRQHLEAGQVHLNDMEFCEKSGKQKKFYSTIPCRVREKKKTHKPAPSILVGHTRKNI